MAAKLFRTLGAQLSAKMSPLCPSSLAIGTRFPYRTLVVIGGRGGGNRTAPTQPTTGWPNALPCGANCVHHSCGQSCFSEGQGDSSVDGAGGARSAPHLPGV